VALIVVAGALANKPHNGGAAWTRLSWPLGLRHLGCDVYFFEQIDECADDSGAACEFDRSANLAYFADVTARFGLAGRAALFSQRDGRAAGLDSSAAAEIADAADLLVNISGHLTLDALKPRFRKRVFVDQDPGYTQFWHLNGLAEDRLRDHHFYFTVGENIGTPGCVIPCGGIAWRPLRQPVVLDSGRLPRAMATPRSRPSAAGGDRTAASPSTDGCSVPRPMSSGSSSRCQPCRTNASKSRCPSIHPTAGTVTRCASTRGRSSIREPWPATRGVFAVTSRAGARVLDRSGHYVETRSGWFAIEPRGTGVRKAGARAGSGFTARYPTGCGLVAFRTLDEAAHGARAIVRDYGTHSRAARAIAEEFFDSDTVLTSFLRDVDVTI
jgi:hypothetical protein